MTSVLVLGGVGPLADTQVVELVRSEFGKQASDIRATPLERADDSKRFPPSASIPQRLSASLCGVRNHGASEAELLLACARALDQLHRAQFVGLWFGELFLFDELRRRRGQHDIFTPFETTQVTEVAELTSGFPHEGSLRSWRSSRE